MEGFLLMLVQWMVQILIAAVGFALLLAALSGRLLAILLPLAFRLMVALVVGTVRLLRSRGHPKPMPSNRWVDWQSPVARAARQNRPRPAVTYRKRYTVENFWRSGDR